MHVYVGIFERIGINGRQYVRFYAGLRFDRRLLNNDLRPTWSKNAFHSDKFRLSIGLGQISPRHRALKSARSGPVEAPRVGWEKMHINLLSQPVTRTLSSSI